MNTQTAACLGLFALLAFCALPQTASATGNRGAHSTISSCTLTTPRRADEERIVLLGHNYDRGGAPGETLTSHILSPNGRMRATGHRSNIGITATDIAFVPSGQIAFAVGERGALVSMRVGRSGAVRVIDRVQLPSALYENITVSQTDNVLWLTAVTTGERGGVVSVSFDCRGEMRINNRDFMPMPMAYAMTVLPGGQQALLAGGQPATGSASANDLHLLARRGNGWRVVSSANLFNDRLTIPSIAVSADGRTALIPNASIYSREAGDVVAVSIHNNRLREIGRRSGVESPGTVIFPTNGNNGYIAQPQAGRISGFGTTGSVREVESVRGLGIVDRMAVVRRGQLRDTIIAPRSTARGDHLVDLYRIENNGNLRRMSSNDLGAGVENIVHAVAVQP